MEGEEEGRKVELNGGAEALWLETFSEEGKGGEERIKSADDMKFRVSRCIHEFEEVLQARENASSIANERKKELS